MTIEYPIEIKEEEYQDMKKFILAHSDIEEKFIDDFFYIQQSQEYKDYYPHVIDLDVFSEWIKVTKGHLKETLISRYKKYKDYKIVDKKPTTRKPKETILLTINCFKKMALRSNSEAGGESI